MFKRFFTYCFLLWGMVVFTTAQVTFNVVLDKPQIKVGERVQLSFVITTTESVEVNNLTLPNFKGFQMLGKNSRNNFSYSNGKSTQQYIETIVLFAQKAGNYTIGSANVNIDGKNYKTEPLNIVVSKSEKDSEEENSLNTFVKMEIILSKDEVYANESITADVKLFAKSYDLLRRRYDIEVPGISGFQVKEISENQERNFQQEIIDGNVCVSEEIAQFQLTPTQTGELEIPEFKIRLAIPIGLFDQKIVLLKTKPKKIKVKKFPNNAPKDFEGAVGDFKIKTYIDDSTLEVNEPINYEVELIGEGNLSSIQLPKIEIPNGLEVYPPKRRNAYKETTNGGKGKIVDAYVIVPQYGGNYTIPKITFTFFNPKEGEYKTITTYNYSLEVKGKKKEESTPVNSDLNASDDDIEVEQDTLAQSQVDKINNKVKEYIKIPDLPKFDDKKETSKAWYFLLIIPIIGLITLLLSRKKKKKLKKVETQKQTHLNKKEIKQDLSKALEELEIAKNHQNINQFTSQSQVVLNKIVALFSDYTEELKYTESQASEIFSNKVSDTFIHQWETLHKKNLLMRYSGSINNESLADLYTQYQQLVKDSLNKS